MIEFDSFEFSGDRFYQKDTQVPLALSGLALLKGKNLDGETGGKSSNGTGKTRLVQILEGFIYGKNPRGNFKKTILSSFAGTLKFKDGKGDRWSFAYSPKEAVGAWTIHKNDLPIKVSHKPSDNQEQLQKVLGISREDWNFFVYINQNSLNILMRGKPTEKRNYLEGFFNIDTFYSQKFEVYNSKWKRIKDDLEILKNDRIRLDAINEARQELPGGKWIELQLENCDSALLLIKENIATVTEQQNEVSKQLDIWNQYHTLFTQLQGLDAKWLKQEHEKLVKAKIELEDKAKKRLHLESFLRLKLAPHQARKPKTGLSQPLEDKPDNKEITAKEVALNQMRDKLRLKKQITPLTKEIAELEQQLVEIPNAVTLDINKTQLHKQRLDAEEHYKLIQKGGDACPTCKQPLSFILDGMTPQDRKLAIELKIKEILGKEKECLQQITLHSSMSKLTQQLAILKEQFDRYPTFGTKLSDAEVELTALKEVASKWEAFDREQETAAKWQATQDLYEVEARGLGYPDLLNEDVSESLNKINEQLPGVIEDLKQFDRFDTLAELVINQPQLLDLEQQKQTGKEDLDVLFSRVESLNEFKGVLRTQLTNITALRAQAEILEAKVAKQESTESECKILELLNNFYSPTGFKVYELKRRCQKLIERANYWSKLFFQEPYEWSLSDDLDDLDFFIQPSHDPDTEPYPIALLSSGEFNRAARVLLFSQLELIPPSKKTNLLFLDEIEGNLDEAGMTAFCEVVLPKLKETFPDRTIVVISHHASLHNSGVIDHIWLAERKDRKTTLTVYPDYQRKRA